MARQLLVSTHLFTDWLVRGMPAVKVVENALPEDARVVGLTMQDERHVIVHLESAEWSGSEPADLPSPVFEQRDAEPFHPIEPIGGDAGISSGPVGTVSSSKKQKAAG